jgi:Family of unknown function (DUF5709)
MPQERDYEANDLVDYEVLDAADTLVGAPGDDPLDRGVVPPERWSRAIRFDTTVSDQDAARSLDGLLAVEEPDISFDSDDSARYDDGWDENATEDDVVRLGREDGPDPRSGRLTEDEDGTVLIANADYVAHDAGPDGGGATAEEAAIHVLNDEG